MPWSLVCNRLRSERVERKKPAKPKAQRETSEESKSIQRPVSDTGLRMYKVPARGRAQARG